MKTGFLLLAAAGALVTGCAAADGGPAVTSPAPAPAEGGIPAALGGGEWNVFEVGGVAVEGVTMLFQDGRVGGRGGCNRYTGPVSFSGSGAMKVGATAMTMMACAEDRMALEQRFAKALEQVTGYALAPDGTLVLSGASGPLMRARRAAD